MGNGLTLTQTFDTQSQLTEQSQLLQRHYQYDKQNQLIQCREQITISADKNTSAKQTQRSFSYNPLSQLVSAKCENQTNKQTAQIANFEWDAFGNPKVDTSR